MSGLRKKWKLIMEGPFPAVWKRQADCSVWKTHRGKARRRAWKRRSGRSSAGAPKQQIATVMETKPKAEWFILCAGQTEEDSVSADISSWQLSGHLHRPAHTDLLDGSFLQQSSAHPWSIRDSSSQTSGTGTAGGQRPNYGEGSHKNILRKAYAVSVPPLARPNVKLGCLPLSQP